MHLWNLSLILFKMQINYFRWDKKEEATSDFFRFCRLMTKFRRWVTGMQLTVSAICSNQPLKDCFACLLFKWMRVTWFKWISNIRETAMAWPHPWASRLVRDKPFCGVYFGEFLKSIFFVISVRLFHTPCVFFYLLHLFA